VRKPCLRKPLRRGSILYHGTSSGTSFRSLEGPAWVSDSYQVARNFVRWAGGSGKPRVVAFELVAAPRLAIIRSDKDMDDLVAWLGESSDVHDLAESLCQSGAADGWHVPDNYPEGSDTMLCEPERFLSFVSSENV